MLPFLRLCFLCLVCAVAAVPARAADLATAQPNVQIRLKDLPAEGERLQQLTTVVDGKEYPIDKVKVATGVARLDGYAANAGDPAWYLDPAGKFLYYTTLIGCGFESDGMLIFRADLYGRRIEPVLGRCDNLRMTPLSYREQNYLLIREGNSGVGDTGFWLFQTATASPLIHAAGTLEAVPGAATWKYCPSYEAAPERCAPVMPETVLQGRLPIQLLPRYPLRARTAQAQVELRLGEGSSACGLRNSGKTERIPAKGAEVAVLDTCRDRGVYEVYYRGLRGTVPGSQLQGFKIK